MNDVIIRTDNLVKTYFTNSLKTNALNGVSLEIPRGSFSCIVGPSGCGKSTLLHLMGALDKPTDGHILIDRLDTADLSYNDLAELRAKKIGFVFQFFNLLTNLSAQENVETAMLFSGKVANAQRQRASELLTLVGIGEKLNAKPYELSGGQQQRVAIARALANDPPILLMDEPTGNLDSESEGEVLAQILNLHKKGKTIVTVTHNREIAKMAEVVFYMKDGKLVENVTTC